jgi:hypothetical protein
MAHVKVFHGSTPASDYPTFNQNTTGSAGSLASAQNFSITGDATASAVSFDGTGAVVLNLALGENSVDSSELVNGSVDGTHLANNQIQAEKLKGIGQSNNGVSGQLLIGDGNGSFSWRTDNMYDITAMTDKDADLAVADEIPYYDSANSNHRAMSITNLRDFLAPLLGGTGLTGASGAIGVDTTQVITSITTNSGTLAVTGDMTISGDLTITGNTITTSAETLEIADNMMILNSDLTGSTAVDAGFKVNRASDTSGSGKKYEALWFDESRGAWAVGSTDSAGDWPTAPAYLSQITQKAGAPSGTVGNVGDFIWDTDNDEMYIRTS